VTAVLWLILVVGLLLGGVLGYLCAVFAGGPLVDAIRERQRVERERRLAELQLRHLSHQAMQHLLDEALKP